MPDDPITPAAAGFTMPPEWEQCLLDPNRNPNLGREEIAACLRDYWA